MSPYQRGAQRQSRHVEPPTPSGEHGVVAPPSGGRSPLAEVRQASCGPVRNTRQLQVADIRVASPRSAGMGNGCAQPFLGRDVGVCLSTYTTTSKSPSKSPPRTGRTDPHRALVAEKTVDRGLARTQSRTASGTSCMGKVTVPTKIKHVPQQSGHLTPARLARVARGVEATGFSKKVAARIARGRLRSTSLKVYDSKWKRFSTWCTENAIDPWDVSIQNVADFLLSLFEQGLEVRTITGYRSAIASTLGQRLDVGHDVSLTQLVKSFFVDRPVRQNVFPQWDLSIVLAGLRLAPFEHKNMSSVLLTDLTYKTVFLLTLASGARRGEIHALDHSRTIWSTDKNVVTLRPNPTFMAKNHRPDQPITAFMGFKVRAMSADLAKDDPDRSLCPVRLLKFYLARTHATRAGRKRLWLPLRNTSSGDICAATVSSWITKAIRLAYAAADKVPELRQLHRIRAHEARAIASSWDALKQVSFQDIMSACRWRAHSTFSDFYLRDLTSIEDSLFALSKVPTPSMCKP